MPSKHKFASPPNNEQLAEAVVDAIWTMWTTKTYITHGDYATVEQMLTIARDTANVVSRFMDRTHLADQLYSLMQERIVTACVAVKAGAVFPASQVVQ